MSSKEYFYIGLKDSYLTEIPHGVYEIYREAKFEFESACDILSSSDVVPEEIYLQAQSIRSLSVKLMAIMTFIDIWGTLEKVFQTKEWGRLESTLREGLDA